MTALYFPQKQNSEKGMSHYTQCKKIFPWSEYETYY